MLHIHGGIWKVVDSFLTGQDKTKGSLFPHPDSLFLIQEDALPGMGCSRLCRGTLIQDEEPRNIGVILGVTSISDCCVK